MATLDRQTTLLVRCYIIVSKQQVDLYIVAIETQLV